MSKYLFSTSLVALVAAASAANAQEAAQPVVAGIGDIIVTAQFREENLQKAPIAVDVVSGDDLAKAGVTNLNAMSRLAPSLQIGQPAGPGSIIFVRGIGSNTANSFTDPSVGVSFNGVPLARPYSVSGLLFDLQRVEVLKGPQGTLFGRNSVSGAININPNLPKLGQFGGDVGVEIGDYDNRKFNGAINVPIGENIAVRAATQIIKRDGYNTDGTADEDSQAGRLSGLFEPSDTFSFLVTGDYFHLDGKGNGGVINGLGYNLEERVGVADPRLSDGVGGNDWANAPNTPFLPPFVRPFTPFAPGEQFQDNTHWGVSAKIDWQTPLGALTAIAAHREDELNYLSGGPGLALDYSGRDPRLTGSGPGEENDQSSIEVRLASPDEQKLSWIVGAYGLTTESTSRISINSRYAGHPATSFQNFKSGEDSWAVFADGTYNLTDAVRLLAGVRYTEVEKTGSGTFRTDAPTPGVGFCAIAPAACPPPSIATIPTALQQVKWDSTTWRAGIQWDVTDDSMLFATVSTGWHAGGYSFYEPQIRYEPEEITAYTIGSKNKFFDGRLLANAEVFYWELTDQQTSAVNLSLPSGGSVLRTFNVAASTVKGAEFELQYKATDTTKITGQLQYLDNSYDNLIYTQFSAIAAQDILVPSACSSQTAVLFPGGAPFDGNVIRDCSGVTPPQAAEWTLNLGIEQTIPLSSGASIVGALFGHYESERRVVFDFGPTNVVDASTTADATLSYNTAGGNWSVTGFVNNLTDETVIHNQFTFPPSGVTVAQLRPPRTYGVRLALSF